MDTLLSINIAYYKFIFKIQYFRKADIMGIFTGKTLLITGGTGSFGHAVMDRFLSTDIGEIRIFSRDEKKQDDMRHEYQAKMPEVAEKIKFYIGDVRDINSVKNAMNGVDYIFHAAALKQVPSCEFFPIEAVKTNSFRCLFTPFGTKKGFIYFYEELNSPHLSGDYFFNVWAKHWVEMIDDLPEAYDPEKESLRKLRSQDLWSFIKCIKMCRENKISTKNVLDYKYYISKVSDVPWLIYWIFAFLPSFVSYFVYVFIRPIHLFLKKQKSKKIRKSF